MVDDEDEEDAERENERRSFGDCFCTGTCRVETPLVLVAAEPMLRTFQHLPERK